MTTSSWLSRQMPVGVRRLVVEDPGTEEAAVSYRLPADRVEERAQSEMEPPQVVEGNGREVVVLEVVGGVEIPEVPPPGRLDHGAPLGGVLRVDRVVLAQPVQGEGD